MCVEVLMKMYRWLTLVAAALISVLAPLNFAAASGAASATSPEPCAMRLSVELTPDVPNPRDLGFLSSLLSNHPDYQLTLQHQRDGSVIVLELAGPGPEYQCQNVIETMRRDARVLSVHVDSDELQTMSLVTAPAAAEEKSSIHFSHAGIASLFYWAAHNPSQAWRVMVPVEPDDAGGAYAHISARCAVIADARTGIAGCLTRYAR
jgi:hypothetical protein